MFIYLGFCKRVNKNAPLAEKIKTKIIQWYTKSQYFHVILGINGQYISSEPSNGVICKPIEELENVLDYDFYRIRLSVAPLTKQQLAVFKRFIREQIGKEYDWLGIIGRVFTILRDNSNKWFCSEIVAKLLQLLYVEELLCYEPSEITPGKLYQLLSHKLEKITITTIGQFCHKGGII